MFQSFEDLDVWKRACQLCVDVYHQLKGCKDFVLRDQMCRSALSIPSNIAEGHECAGLDFVRYLTIARGSAAELRTQCYIAAKVGALSVEGMQTIVQELKEISKMLTGLAKSIKSKRGK